MAHRAYTFVKSGAFWILKTLDMNSPRLKRHRIQQTMVMCVMSRKALRGYTRNNPVCNNANVHRYVRQYCSSLHATVTVGWMNINGAAQPGRPLKWWCIKDEEVARSVRVD